MTAEATVAESGDMWVERWLFLQKPPPLCRDYSYCLRLGLGKITACHGDGEDGGRGTENGYQDMVNNGVGTVVTLGSPFQSHQD